MTDNPLHDAVRAHYARDPEQVRREASAARFVPSKHYERLIKLRVSDPAEFKRQVGAGRGDLELALYQVNRDAAIEQGAFDPATYSEGDQNR